MKLLLYYAGMANDANHTEQIGVALSSNSTQFTRIGDGLIIPRDPLIPWKNLRTCNPAVLKLPDGRFAMFYQGVGNPRGPVSRSTEPQVTSNGLAFSEDGIRWECEPQPILSYKMLKELDPAQDPSSSIGLIEPSVIYCNGLCQIWFVYVHRTMPGNALVYATSRDLRCWDIRPMSILTGCDFGGYDLFYPQVVQRPDGFELWFTLRNSKTGVHGIFRMQSVDGIAWSGLLQVMPPPVGALPWATVRPEMPTVFAAATENARLELLPLTVTMFAPGPLMAKSSVMFRTPEVSPMVPCTPGAKRMTSGPGWPFASVIACRSDPGPLSARVRTV